MSVGTSLLWFRQDLRVVDNPALSAAVKRGGPIIPVFIWAPEEEKPWEPGGASRWWLHESLGSLSRELRERGSHLVIRRGPALRTVRELVRETHADAVFWNRRYEPVIVERDGAIQEALQTAGVMVETHNANLLLEPWKILNKAGKPFRVFTPFWKACLSLPEAGEPLPAPRRLPAPGTWPQTLSVPQLALEPKVDWAAGLRGAWSPGSGGATVALKRFLGEALFEYEETRNRPDLPGVSRLSPHLHFGEIGPRQIWHAVRDHARASRKPKMRQRAATYLRQIIWREFAYHLLHHFPHTTDRPLRPEFESFPWNEDKKALRAWQRGNTGYPMVDAGMRELWTTGWMHNRVRMIVASFLVKDLLLPWQTGARWFWDTLVDADLANNTLGWQWTAGCGADAAPYFRIFNPVGQGEKFDPNGDYVRRWVPELHRLPAPWIHRPWEASSRELTAAGVALGRTYPKPIVDHAFARERALAALATVRKKKGDGQ